VGTLLVGALGVVGLLLLIIDPAAFPQWIFNLFLLGLLFGGYYLALLRLARLISRVTGRWWSSVLWVLAMLPLVGGYLGALFSVIQFAKQGFSADALTLAAASAVFGYLLAGILYLWYRRTRPLPSAPKKEEEVPHG
jgi:hypothetical protein